MDKLDMHTPDRVEQNVARIGELFPNCITESLDDTGKPMRAIDFEVLKQELSKSVVEGPKERYQFTWPDKKKAMLLANSPISATLRPCPEESVNFDDTENLYIEGDNLDVLKLLQETYLGKIKMIYIDPPYNTGNDFVYEDDFDIDAETYRDMSGDYDDQGNRLKKNNDTNGRFHTDWLNMIYPRLKLARDLLTEDGVIFISIDYHEFDSLKGICREIFGTKNFIGEIIWQTATDNNPSQISMEHEYILCYAKNLLNQPKWMIQSEKASRIKQKYFELKQLHKSNLSNIRTELKKWINENEETLKGVTHYKYIDENGVYYPGNSSNTKPGGYSFDIIHPITGCVCSKPEYGYRWPYSTFVAANNRGDVEWGVTEETIPKIKKRIETVTEMLKSYYYEDNRYWTKYLNSLFGSKVFENPKSVNLLEHILKYSTYTDSIILDFFSGSATTAHAVMQLNAEDGGNRKYIMVQIPEATEESSEAFKAGYKNICEIGKERIRRAGKKILEENADKPGIEKLDTGFRVLKLDSSNMKDVYYTPEQFVNNTELFDQTTDNIKEARKPEDLLFQVMLDLGVLPSSRIETFSIGGKRIYSVRENYLVACFEDDLTDDIITEIAKRKPFYAVLRDSSFHDDAVAANFEQIFATWSPETIKKVL